MPQISKSQVLSNILYHREYYYGYNGSSAGYPTFSIAYLVYSTSQQYRPACVRLKTVTEDYRIKNKTRISGSRVGVTCPTDSQLTAVRGDRLK